MEKEKDENELRLEEVQKLVQDQKPEFTFHHLEAKENGSVAVYLQGYVQPSDEFKRLFPIDASQASRIEVPMPDNKIFKWAGQGDRVKQVMAEEQNVFIFDHVEYPDEGGIYVYLKDVLHPTKGFPTPEAVAANNIMKRIFISQIRLLSKNKLFAISLLSIKRFSRWLREYTNMAETVLSPYVLEEKRYSNPNREIYKLLNVFLLELGIEHDLAFNFPLFFTTMLEYDDAYRYRIEDLATVTSIDDLIKHPRREFKKILKTLAERDNRPHMLERFKAISLLLSLVLYIPFIRRAYTKALNSIDFTKIQMDEADRYHTLRMMGYKFGGRPIEDRLREFIGLHKGVAPQSFTIKAS